MYSVDVERDKQARPSRTPRLEDGHAKLRDQLKRPDGIRFSEQAARQHPSDSPTP